MSSLLGCVYSQISNIYFSRPDVLVAVNWVIQSARNVANSGIHISIKVEFLT